MLYFGDGLSSWGFWQFLEMRYLGKLDPLEEGEGRGGWSFRRKTGEPGGPAALDWAQS